MSIRSSNKITAEFSFASISDIVFLLLIYFMLTSSFVRQASIEVELPTSAADKPTPSQNSITIGLNGVLAWNQRRVDSREELLPLIEKVLTDDDKENDVITLRVDKRVSFDEAAFVMGAVAANQGKIVILTEKD
jgi:biopolymer transport protein ExbD